MLTRLSAPSVVVDREIYPEPLVISEYSYNGLNSSWHAPAWRTLAATGGLLLLGVAVLALIVRGRPAANDRPQTVVPSEPDEVDAAELQKRRREAEVIRRMYGVMDRIESRIERLESSLLP